MGSRSVGCVLGAGRTSGGCASLGSVPHFEWRSWESALKSRARLADLGVIVLVISGCVDGPAGGSAPAPGSGGSFGAPSTSGGAPQTAAGGLFGGSGGTVMAPVGGAHSGGNGSGGANPGGNGSGGANPGGSGNGPGGAPAIGAGGAAAAGAHSGGTDAGLSNDVAASMGDSSADVPGAPTGPLLDGGALGSGQAAGESAGISYFTPVLDGPLTDIASDAAGNGWFTNGSRVGRITPAGIVTQFRLPVEDGGSPWAASSPPRPTGTSGSATATAGSIASSPPARSPSSR